MENQKDKYWNLSKDDLIEAGLVLRDKISEAKEVLRTAPNQTFDEIKDYINLSGTILIAEKGLITMRNYYKQKYGKSDIQANPATK